MDINFLFSLFGVVIFPFLKLNTTSLSVVRYTLINRRANFIKMESLGREAVGSLEEEITAY